MPLIWGELLTRLIVALKPKVPFLGSNQRNANEQDLAHIQPIFKSLCLLFSVRTLLDG